MRYESHAHNRRYVGRRAHGAPRTEDGLEDESALTILHIAKADLAGKCYLLLPARDDVRQL